MEIISMPIDLETACVELENYALDEMFNRHIKELLGNSERGFKDFLKLEHDVYLLGATKEGIVFITGYAASCEIEEGTAISRVLEANYYYGVDFTTLDWYYTNNLKEAGECFDLEKECNREIFITIDECRTFMNLTKLEMDFSEVKLVKTDKKRNWIETSVKQMKAFRQANIKIADTPFEKAIWKTVGPNKYIKEVCDGRPVSLRNYCGGETYCLEIK